VGGDSVAEILGDFDSKSVDERRLQGAGQTQGLRIFEEDADHLGDPLRPQSKLHRSLIAGSAGTAQGEQAEREPAIPVLLGLRAVPGFGAVLHE